MLRAPPIGIGPVRWIIFPTHAYIESKLFWELENVWNVEANMHLEKFLHVESVWEGEGSVHGMNNTLHGCNGGENVLSAVWPVIEIRK